MLGVDQWVFLCISNGNIRRRQWHPIPVLLPGKSHGWRSLVGCSPWSHEESDTTEWLHFHFSLSCIGEGNGNPLQCSWLENPRDGGAWWAAVYGVPQSQTRLKRLSSSSNVDIRHTTTQETFWLHFVKLNVCIPHEPVIPCPEWAHICVYQGSYHECSQQPFS